MYSYIRIFLSKNIMRHSIRFQDSILFRFGSNSSLYARTENWFNILEYILYCVIFIFGSWKGKVLYLVFLLEYYSTEKKKSGSIISDGLSFPMINNIISAFSTLPFLLHRGQDVHTLSGNHSLVWKKFQIFSLQKRN